MVAKEWTRKFLFIVPALLLALAIGHPARADLIAVSEDTTPVDVGGTLFNFPVWYQDQNFLKLEACLDAADLIADIDFCLAAVGVIEDEDGNPVVDVEFLYFLAEAQIADFPVQPGAGDSATRIRLIQAVEATVVADEVDAEENPLPPFEAVFNAVIITGRGFSPSTTYSVTTPYGVFAVPTDDRGRMRFEVPDPHPVGTPFAEALGGPIQKFVYWDSELPQSDGGFFYIGDPLVEHTIFGSPAGTNFLRVTGPNNFDIQTNLFSVVGKVYLGDGNDPAIANFDLAAAKLGGGTIDFDVLANDVRVNVPINPTSLEKAGAITAVTGDGTVTTVRELDKVLLRFTPPATAGLKSFDYTVETFTGAQSIGSVDVFVENLLFNQAEYRARTGKWMLDGTSNFRDLSVPVSATETAYVTGLFGAQEVPPVTSAASGEFMAIFDSALPAAFDFDLTINVPEGVTINRAHIHLGATGVNGGILFNLCGEPVGNPDVPCAVSPEGVIAISGTLTEADFLAVGDVTTFAQAVAAIQGGGTYVNAHSLVNTGGEIRGQIGRNVISLRMGENGPAIGAAEVQAGDGPNLPWSYSGKSIGSLGAAPHMVHAESALGITDTIELRLR